ncbi:MAG: EI24 domain-containing protein [Leptothrix sp. (in: b-proteobacteria)]
MPRPPRASDVLSAFWRAAAYCLHPRLILMSLTPVAIAGGVAFGLAWFFWEGAVDAVRVALDQTPWLGPISGWLNQLSGGAFRNVIGPLVVVALSVPVLLISAMLLVSAFMGAAIVDLVARRRFPELVKAHGGSWLGSLAGSIGYSLLALLALALSTPLWLIPPFALVLPPLIWGWLTYRLMSYDALAEHASHAERVELLRLHRWPLLGIGVATGYLGAAPSLVWVTGALALPMMPLLMPLFVWLYTLLFAFASAWFAHYALAALARLRAERLAEAQPPAFPPITLTDDVAADVAALPPPA